ncbi:hypothetical protein L1887_19826 [Cichorium endivia]|nr:hypothetical protein L1887_19826 [Cichorium endivia]
MNNHRSLGCSLPTPPHCNHAPVIAPHTIAISDETFGTHPCSSTMSGIKNVEIINVTSDINHRRHQIHFIPVYIYTQNPFLLYTRSFLFFPTTPLSRICSFYGTC